MKVAAIVGPQQATMVDKPDPVARQDVVVVKIEVAPMCTEYQAFRSGTAGDCLGHEAAGEVVDAGQSNKVRVGDRVVVMPQSACGKCYLCVAGDFIHCQDQPDLLALTGNSAGTATYAQYLLKQDWLLVPIPDDMSYEHAVMACCGMGPTFGALQLMRVDAFDTVLITGMGPVGLGGVINAVQRGARVIAVESNPYRARLALELGAVAVIDPAAETAAEQVLALTNGRGADKAIESSGQAAAKTFLLNCVRRKGHIAIVGWTGQIDATTVTTKGLTIHGAWHWNLRHGDKMLQAIAGSGASIDKLITHHFSLSRVQEAFELQVSGQCGKVVLHPWQ